MAWSKRNRIGAVIGNSLLTSIGPGSNFTGRHPTPAQPAGSILALVGVAPSKPLSRGFKDFGMLLSPAQTTELLTRVAQAGGLVNLVDQLAPPSGGMSDDALDAAWRMTRLLAAAGGAQVGGNIKNVVELGGA
jgi:hypothetical protein